MGGKPFYQRSWFLATAAGDTSAGGVLTLAGAAGNAIDNLLGDEVANFNTMIVLDASGKMRERWGESGTKFDAAARAVEDFVGPMENYGFGLRTLGGRCPGPGERRVEIGAKHNDDVLDAVDETQPRGEANLTQTLVAATDDLADPDRVPSPDKARIVVFTGSADTCGRDDDLSALRENLRQLGVRTVLKIVAVEPTAKSTRQLRRLESRLGKQAVQVEVADSQVQLGDAVAAARVDAQTTATEPPEPPPTIPTEPDPDPGPDPAPDPNTTTTPAPEPESETGG